MTNTSFSSGKSIAVIGGGPAGLMAADVISQAGIKVDIFDAMPTVGRKFLMAGKGGLNITHSEPHTIFLSRYGDRQTLLKPMLNAFTAIDVQEWVHSLGIKTFIGSSGRVFPAEMKAAPLLRAWLHRLRQAGVTFHRRHRWTNWHQSSGNSLLFSTPDGDKIWQSDAVILALGGGSWPQLGATGEWVTLLSQIDVKINPFLPANCGFDVAWSEFFRTRFSGQPIKSIVGSIQDQGKAGDCIATNSGIEGGVVYALTASLREEIKNKGLAILTLDLIPTMQLTKIISRLSKPRGKQSMPNHLRKTLGIDGVKAALLREFVPSTSFNNLEILSQYIKALPIPLIATRPLVEAISSAGGVSFDSLNEHLMLLNRPGIFCAGEMLDWEAPTGGYLLNACFASGRTAGFGAINYLKNG